MTSVHSVPSSIVKKQFSTITNKHSRPIFNKQELQTPGPSEYTIQSKIGSTSKFLTSPSKSFKSNSTQLNTTDLSSEVKLSYALEKLRGSRNQPNLSLTYNVNVNLVKPRSKHTLIGTDKKSRLFDDGKFLLLKV